MKLNSPNPSTTDRAGPRAALPGGTCQPGELGRCPGPRPRKAAFRRTLRGLAWGLLGTGLGGSAGGLFGLLHGALLAALSAGSRNLFASVLWFAAAGAGAGLLTGLAAALCGPDEAGPEELRDEESPVPRRTGSYRYARPTIEIKSVTVEAVATGTGGAHARGPSLN